MVFHVMWAFLPLKHIRNVCDLRESLLYQGLHFKCSMHPNVCMCICACMSECEKPQIVCSLPPPSPTRMHPSLHLPMWYLTCCPLRSLPFLFYFSHFMLQSQTKNNGSTISITPQSWLAVLPSPVCCLHLLAWCKQVRQACCCPTSHWKESSPLFHSVS